MNIPTRPRGLGRGLAALLEKDLDVRSDEQKKRETMLVRQILRQLHQMEASDSPELSNAGRRQLDLAAKLIVEGDKALASKLARVHNLTHGKNQISPGKKKNAIALVRKLERDGLPITKAREQARLKYGIGTTTMRDLTPTGKPRGRPKK